MRGLTLLVAELVIVFALGGMPLFAQHGRGHGGRPGGFPSAPPDSVRSDRAGSHGMHPGGEFPRPGPANNISGTPHENKVGARLAHNTALSSRLQGLLPAGTNVQGAAKGFKNLGQFVAAVHVSRNLDIPFDQLKARMVGPDAKNLGKAIQELKPEAHAKAEAAKAKRQAEADIKESGS